jgi:hypothetical protein
MNPTQKKIAEIIKKNTGTIMDGAVFLEELVKDLADLFEAEDKKWWSVKGIREFWRDVPNMVPKQMVKSEREKFDNIKMKEHEPFNKPLFLKTAGAKE